MRSFKHLILPLLPLLLLALAPTARAQDQEVHVTATVEETTVGTEETVVYSLAVEGASFGDIEVPGPPETEGLVLLQATPSTQRNITFVNGVMRQSIGYQWRFRPVREGAARFKPLTVKIKGVSYTTDVIRLTVVPQAQRPQGARRTPFTTPNARTVPPRPDGDASRIDPKDLFIRAIPSARRAYQNEQLTIDYQLFFREGIQIRQSRLADSWDAEGFWREDLEVETRPIPRSVVENGLRYNMITLKRVAVFPTRTGRLRIDPLRIETEVFKPFRSSDPFDQLFSLRSQFEPVELASPPVVIESLTLPNGAPPSFNGSVGRFRMDVDVDRSDLEVGEPVQVTVEITGTGNLALMEGPAFEPPSVFERYDPQVDVQIDQTGRRVAGSKTFRQVLVPRSNGTFVLPAFAFSFFDPQERAYRTLRSEPTTVRVTGTAAAPALAGTTRDGLPVDDIAGPLSEAEWRRADRTPLYRNAWAYAALALPALAVAGLFGYRRHATRLATDVEYARGRRAHPVARRHLKQAEALLLDDAPRSFYEEVARALLGFVGNRLNVGERAFTRPQLDARLADAGVDEPTRAEVQALLDECDRARFAPVRPTPAEMQAAHDRAARLIVALDEALRQPASVA